MILSGMVTSPVGSMRATGLEAEFDPHNGQIRDCTSRLSLLFGRSMVGENVYQFMDSSCVPGLMRESDLLRVRGSGGPFVMPNLAFASPHAEGGAEVVSRIDAR